MYVIVGRSSLHAEGQCHGCFLWPGSSACDVTTVHGTGGCVPSSVLSPPVCSNATPQPSTRKWREPAACGDEAQLVALCLRGCSALGVLIKRLRTHLLSVTCCPCTFILTQDRKQSLVQPVSVPRDRQSLVGAATVGTKFLIFSANCCWAQYSHCKMFQSCLIRAELVPLAYSHHYHALRVKLYPWIFSWELCKAVFSTWRRHVAG